MIEEMVSFEDIFYLGGHKTRGMLGNRVARTALPEV